MKKFRLIMIILFITFFCFFSNNISAISLDGINIKDYINDGMNLQNEENGINKIGTVYWKNTDIYNPLYDWIVGATKLSDGIVVATQGHVGNYDINYWGENTVLTKVDFSGNVLWRKVVSGRPRGWLMEYNSIFGGDNWYAINIDDNMGRIACCIFDKDGNEIDTLEDDIVGMKTIGKDSIIYGMETITKINESGKVEWQVNASPDADSHGMPSIRISDNYIYANYNEVFDYDGNKVDVYYNKYFDYDNYYWDSYDKTAPVDENNKEGNWYRETDYILDFCELNKDSMVTIVKKEIEYYEGINEYGNVDDFINSEQGLYMQIRDSSSGRLMGEILLKTFETQDEFWNYEYRENYIYSGNNNIYILKDNRYYNYNDKNIYVTEYHVKDTVNAGGKNEYIISEYANTTFELNDYLLRERGPITINNNLLLFGSRFFNLNEGIASIKTLLNERGEEILNIRTISQNSNNLILTEDIYNSAGSCIYIYNIEDNITLSSYYYDREEIMPYESMSIYGNDYIYVCGNTRDIYGNIDESYNNLEYSLLYTFGDKVQDVDINKERVLDVIEESRIRKINLKEYKDILGEEKFEGEDPYVAGVRGLSGYYVCTYIGRIIKYDFAWNIIGENLDEQSKMGFGYVDIDINPDIISLGEDNCEQVICVTADGIVVDYIFPLKNTEVIVRYLDIDTNKELIDQERIPGYVGKEFLTKDKINEINNLYNNEYKFIKVVESATGIMKEEITYVDYYYQKRQGEVEVNYLEYETNNILADQENISGIVGTSYKTIDKINEINGVNEDKYELVTIDGKNAGTISEDKQIINYYYQKKNGEIEVNYLEIETGKILANQEKYKERIDEPYVTIDKLEKINLANNNKYEFVYTTGAEVEGTYKLEKQIINYWYQKKKANVKVLHVLEETDVSDPENVKDVLYPTEEISGKVDDIYTSKNRLEEINLNSKIQYELVTDNVENKTGNMVEDTIYVIYKYRKSKSRVIIEHKDINTNENLLDVEFITGIIGENYITENKLIQINEIFNNKYELVSPEPDNKNGDFKKEEQTITYYYSKKKSNVVVKYIDIDTEEELVDGEEIKGIIDDSYSTKNKIDEINEKYLNSKYILVKTSENTQGKFEINTIEVTYYYKRAEAQVIVKHIDENTGEEIADREYLGGYIGEEYTTNPREIDQYQLVEEKLPMNKDGKMIEEIIEVIYYYKLSKTNEFTNINTGDILINTIIIITILSISGIVYILIRKKYNK